MTVSLYKKEYCEEIIEYFEKARDVFSQDNVGPKPRNINSDTKLSKSASPLIILPTLGRYSSKIKIQVRTLHQWKNKYPKFKDAVAQCMAIQKDMLLQMGLNGHYNVSLVKLILCNNHGWTQKDEITAKGNLTLKFDKQDKSA